MSSDARRAVLFLTKLYKYTARGKNKTSNDADEVILLIFLLWQQPVVP